MNGMHTDTTGVTTQAKYTGTIGNRGGAEKIHRITDTGTDRRSPKTVFYSRQYSGFIRVSATRTFPRTFPIVPGRSSATIQAALCFAGMG